MILFRSYAPTANIAKKPPNGYLSGVKRERIRGGLRWAAAVFCLACLAVFLRDVWGRRAEVEAVLSSSLSSPGLMAAELALMVANLGVEALRWRMVRGLFTDGDAKDDITASLRAISLGNATPGNMGEHLGRALVYADTRQATWASAAASVLQTATIALFGAAACAVLSASGAAVPATAVRIGAAAFAVMCVLAALMAYVFRGRAKLMPGRGRRLAEAALLNAAKVLVFSTQFFLFLRAGRACDGAILFAAVLLYYHLVTLTPRVNIVDVGVKGGMASYVFANGLCDGAAVASAVILIWVINIVAPSVIGFASLSVRRRGGQ